MARNWMIEGKYIEYCSCDLGCPCESMASPTQGHCTGLVGFNIVKGHGDGAGLDGLSVVAAFYFPRAIRHGQGVMHPMIDELASETQRDALLYILSGADQAVGTMFQIFSLIIETIKPPLFAPMTFDWDLDKRRARIGVPSTVRAQSEPIRNPVTDAEHRMIIVLRNGWVIHEAENVAGFAKGIPVRPEPPAQLDGECGLGPEWPRPQLPRVQAENRPALAAMGANASLLEAVLRRDRAVLVAGFVAVFATAWGWLLVGAGMEMNAVEMTGMAGMDGWLMQPAVWTPAFALLIFGMWWVMMVAMMLPSTAPMLQLFARVNRKDKAAGAPLVQTVLFASGYLIA